jgi:glycosyltransferase involved in cell wall biosynthesis
VETRELNILHIDTEKYWRGGQQQVFYLHKYLVGKGINSLLISNKSSELSQYCKKETLPFYEINIVGELDIYAAYKISKYCKKNNIDIIHAHSAHALSIAIIAKHFYPFPKLIGVRRVDFPIRKNLFSRLKYNNSKICKIIAISDFIKKVLILDGIDENKIMTIRSGTDIHKYDKVSPDIHFRERYGIGENDIILGTVAAFAGHKDYPNLLNAFRLVKKEFVNTKLICAGDGPLFDEMKNLAIELSINKDVVFLGFRNDIGQLLKVFDIFILASKKEGLGTSLIDALAVGLPIVAARSGGIPELIEHNKNGILVEAKNHDQLAETLIELMKNKEKQELLSISAKESALRFSIEKTVEQNIELYKNLLRT